jgi:ABC-type branched-subunit amino acid transport system substrate-binding protein
MRRRSSFAFAFAALCALASPGSFASQPLSAEEQAGRRIYLDAITPSGEPLRGLVGAGQTPLSGAALACGNCHGADGKGRPEASVVPPEITWEELSKPYGHVHASRRHGAFGEASLRRALNEGLDPAGNGLDWTMPRYALSRSETAALLAYLKRLSAQSDPGVSDRLLRIGTILPARGPLAPAAEAIRAALAAYLETLNRAGGIHQRRLELVVANDVESAPKRFSAAPVFALVSPFVYDEEAAFGVLIEKAKLPAVGPFTANPQRVGRRSGLAFYVLPGPPEQAASLVDFAARTAKVSGWRAAIVGSGASPYREAAEAADRRCEQLGCGEVTRIASFTGPIDAAAAVKRLKAERREQIFFFGSEGEFARLLDEAGATGGTDWRPRVYAPGSVARAALARRERFGGEVFLVYPASPAERAGSEALSELRREFGLQARHEQAQRSALAAAAVLAEGLRRAGRDLSREGLVRSLESFRHFDPGGFAPPVSYGPDRRVGAPGGYIVALEPERGLVPTSGWIPVE